jgi:hypothetical protein
MIDVIVAWLQAPGQWHDAIVLLGLFFVAGILAMR